MININWKGISSDTISGLIICELPPISKPKMKTFFDIDMVTPEESLGVSTETYNKIIDECLFGDDDKNK